MSDKTSSDGRGEGKPSPSRFRYQDVFEQKFPYYLSIGMTEDQYWNGDCMLAKYYREADELRKERRNQEAWLQGMYIYDAIIRVSPLLHTFVKKGTKAKPYMEEPYPISTKTQNESQVRKEKAISDKGQRYMQAYMLGFNKRFEERK